MSKSNRIRIIGRPRRELDIDLLVRAVLAIAEQRLQDEHLIEEDPHEASA